jgi:hypothetical protein
MMIIPVTQGDTQTNMTFLLGWQCLCFNFLAERWLHKLIKLGGKIIAPKSRIGDSSSSNYGDHEIKVLEKLKRADNLLKVLETMFITPVHLFMNFKHGISLTKSLVEYRNWNGRLRDIFLYVRTGMAVSPLLTSDKII